MITGIEENIFLAALILLLIILFMLSRIYKHEDRFIFWLTLLFSVGAIFSLSGLLFIQLGPEFTGLPDHSPNPQKTLEYFRMLLFFSWILIGILFSKAFNTPMKQYRRILLGMILSFPVTTIAGNFIYQLIL